MERNLSRGQAIGNQGLKPRRRFRQGSRSERGLGLAERGWSLAQDANALWWNLWHMGGTRGAATSTWLSEPTEDTFLEWVLFIVIQFAHEGVRCCDQGPETRDTAFEGVHRSVPRARGRENKQKYRDRGHRGKDKPVVSTSKTKTLHPGLYGLLASSWLVSPPCLSDAARPTPHRTSLQPCSQPTAFWPLLCSVPRQNHPPALRST